MGLNKRLIGAGATASGALTPSENFKAVTYTGTGSSQSITGVGFQPDFVWIKQRGGTTWHNLQDSTRGSTKHVYSNASNSEDTTADGVTSFDSDGFTLGGGNGFNGSGQSMVAWCWKAGGGTTSSNTDGTVTSTVQVNTDAGFSIATYTGSGSTATIGHGLSAAPEMIIAKSTSDAYEWKIWHKDLSSGYQILFNTAAQASDSSVWTTTTPTSTVFSIGTNVGVNGGSKNYVAYAFASIDGFSKFGSYTGTGAAGNLIETGFEPAFIMFKRTDSAGGWLMFDNKRNTLNPRNNRLEANSDQAEQAGSTSKFVDFYSNGFEPQVSDSEINASGGTYIYMAFAADPDTEAPTLADSFNVKTYTGNGGTQSITGVGFKPNMTWIKHRNEANDHVLTDSIRGTGLIYPNGDDAQNQDSQLTSFDSDGFSLAYNTGQNVKFNKSGGAYVAWSWKADDNEPTINTVGSIDSIVSANANSGFSIVKYEGNGTAGATIGHGLSAAPEMVIVKALETTANSSWAVYHTGTGNTKVLVLNTTSATDTNVGYWNNTSPTASTFTLGTYSVVNENAKDYIAYCFHSVSGFSKIGSYTGTGATGNTVTVGFQPDFVMVKATGEAEPWFILDSARDTSNPRDNRLMPDSSAAEDDGSVHTMDFNSDNFTLNGTLGNGTNGSGKNYIYAAFKMNPTPYPLAGNMSFLVIAGGGGGGYSAGGGGGAGGLRTSYGDTSGGGSSSETDITLAAGTYTITIGSGGAGSTGYNSEGTSGVDSSIAKSGITTITSTAGGGGGTRSAGDYTGLSGGSGGGEAGDNSGDGGAGTSNQGFAGGSHSNSGTGGAGGGGASAVGSGHSGNSGGNGGAGLAVEITGSSVSYAGGGGGGGQHLYNPGTGGTGGGGNGGTNAAGSNGTANTGGGAGGDGNFDNNGGTGGSGVVILRLLTSEYSGTTTGSPTVTTDGTHTIIKYTGSGTYVHS